VAYLLAAVSLLLLEALFMQISGVSLILTWPSQALFTQSSFVCNHHCYKLSPFQAHWRKWHCTSFLRPVCLFTVHVGSGSSPLSCGVFLPCHFYKLPAPGCWTCAATPAFSSWLVVRDFPSPLFCTQGTLPSLFCVFFVVIAYYSGFFLFSLCVGRELSWFLHLTWSGDAMHGLEVWRSQRFASSWWFFL
jgi:hypothetical protein